MSQIFQIGGLIMIAMGMIGFAVASLAQIRLARKLEAGREDREGLVVH
jgi:preprotein translocase subunit Sss1